MRVALAQVASPPSETAAARLTRVGQLLRDARGADLVVLPELWLTGYFAFDRYAEAAEPLDGDTVLAAREWARDLRCFLHLGTVLERTGDGRLHNTAVLVSPEGELLHTYRKNYLFGHGSLERSLLVPGHEVSSAVTSFGRVTSAICYDLRFSELWDRLAATGAAIACVPAAWPAARRENWQVFTTCRAAERQLFVLACNAAGAQPDAVLAGRSRVVDPSGEVLAEASDDEQLLLCEIDPRRVDTVRRDFPVLADSRA